MNKIKTIKELNSLDEASTFAGYLAALNGRIDVSRMNDSAYMLGACNGSADRAGKASRAVSTTVIQQIVGRK